MSDDNNNYNNSIIYIYYCLCTSTFHYEIHRDEGFVVIVEIIEMSN